MSLRSTLRKAAGLLVELPPEEPVQHGDPIPNAYSSSTLPASTPSSGTSATDKMWAELEQEAQKSTPAMPPPPAKTVEQIVRDVEGPNLDQIQVSAAALPNAAKPDGSVDFSAIYQSAALPTVPFTSEQVLEMLAALPADLPLDSRRQMHKVSLNSMGKAIGATSENIVADASRKLAALAAYTDNLAKLTSEYTGMAEKKIAALQAQIEETRQGILNAQQKQATETQACTAESHRMDEVLEFFSLDVPPSKYAPPEKPEA
jgi:hypothetical protein